MNYDKKTVLVTGGAGFIGKHTVKSLVDNGFDVIVADRKEQPSDLNCKYYQTDFTVLLSLSPTILYNLVSLDEVAHINDKLLSVSLEGVKDSNLQFRLPKQFSSIVSI